MCIRILVCTVLWKLVSSGSDVHEVGKNLLAWGHRASLALRQVACGQAPSPGSSNPKPADPNLRARLSRLVDALPETSEAVHQVDESSSVEGKWTAVAGLVSHYRGQLRVVDESQWKLMDINGNSESATKQLSRLRPILMRRDALVIVGN